jgi:hypothetical protein
VPARLSAAKDLNAAPTGRVYFFAGDASVAGGAMAAGTGDEGVGCVDGDAAGPPGDAARDSVGSDGTGVGAVTGGELEGEGEGTTTPGANGISSTCTTRVTKCRVSPKQVVGSPTFSS